MVVGPKRHVYMYPLLGNADVVAFRVIDISTLKPTQIHVKPNTFENKINFLFWLSLKLIRMCILKSNLWTALKVFYILELLSTRVKIAFYQVLSI